MCRGKGDVQRVPVGYLVRTWDTDPFPRVPVATPTLLQNQDGRFDLRKVNEGQSKERRPCTEKSRLSKITTDFVVQGKRPRSVGTGSGVWVQVGVKDRGSETLFLS